MIRHKQALFASIMLLSNTGAAFSQHYMGRVLDSLNQEPLNAASIKLLISGVTLQTDHEGFFTFPEGKMSLQPIEVSYVGYGKKQLSVTVPLTKNLVIQLLPQASLLDEAVVNTGFYKVPKERATGSFDFIDQKLFNRSIGTDVISRLEGISSSLHFDRRDVRGETTPNPMLRLRGLSTIQSDGRPLIIVDGFPYENDLNNLNPNDVSSVTLLKDAAAASIWGARAGNGVIVITTKEGRYNQKAEISFSTNTGIGNKPDLYYSKAFLPSDIVMGIEKERFERGDYDEQAQVPIPEYVELLIKKRDRLIGDDEFNRQESLMLRTDVREETSKYLYQKSISQQYALNISGGSGAYKYYFSSGYDHNRANVVGNGFKRININLQNTLKPIRSLEITTGIWYSRQRSVNNGLTLSSLATGSPAMMGNTTPYMRLMAEDGNPAAIVHTNRMAYTEAAENAGLLDWNYRPLNEIRLNDITSGNEEIRVNTGVQYHFLNHFHIDATYQYIRFSGGEGHAYYSPESYYVRNLVNRFTQANGSLIIPHEGILAGLGNERSASHSGRIQANYQQQLSSDHQLTALAGAELRQQVQTTEPGYVLYNYDNEILQGQNTYDFNNYYPVRPSGYATVPGPPGGLSAYTDRFLSYFGNASYSYKDRYILSGSARWDASNLFGVKTNQKGTPLWSLGGSWELSKEAFYPIDVLPYLRLRMTYGSSGNVNKSVSVYPTVTYATDYVTKRYTAGLTTVGNPSLRWERVKTTNLAMDFASQNRRLQGSIEYYVKRSGDLIGADYMAPSTGIITDENVTPMLQNLINYANLQTKGMDIQLNSNNIVGPFRWESSILLSYVKNKVTKFNTSVVEDISAYYSSPPPVAGQSRDMMYALPWYGLNPQNGMPLLYIEGEPTDDYAAYIGSFTPDKLDRAGLSVPPLFGSLRNTFSYRNIELSVLITWKTGYVFRRDYLAPADEYHGKYHADYFNRWQHPGDESRTDVPAYLPNTVPYISQSYAYSEALVTKGDHIRLQDVRLAYSVFEKAVKRLGFNQLNIFVYAQNMGIIWRANKQGLDPDYPATAYPAPRSISFGLQASF